MEDRNGTLGPGASRRQVLRLGAWGALAVALPRVAQARVRLAKPRSLALHHLHTGEDLHVTYWQDGEYVTSALQEIDQLLRDHRTGDVLPIARGLLDQLHALRVLMETSEPFHVVSGYRSPATNRMLAAKGRGVVRRSFHTRGMAVDLSLPGREVSDLQRAALSLRAGGVGLYRDSGFIHLDVGPVRRW